VLQGQLGAEGDGFKIILHGLNLERMCWGRGDRAGLRRDQESRAIWQGTHRVRSPDPHGPGHTASAEACHAAMATLGSMDYAQECRVERDLHEC
jgi:hypothetical protein